MRPYVARSHRAPHAGSRSIVPVPSELNPNVNSLSNVDENVLVRLTAPILFGRDHAHCTRSSATNGSLKVHGVYPMRAFGMTLFGKGAPVAGSRMVRARPKNGFVGFSSSLKSPRLIAAVGTVAVA